MAQPLRPKTVASRVKENTRRVTDERHKPNLPGPYIYVGTFPGDPQTSWQSPEWMNSFTSQPGSLIGFRHGLDGDLDMTGDYDLSAATSGDTAFVLPVEYRASAPPVTQFPNEITPGVWNTATQTIDQTTGAVKVYWDASACTTGQWCRLGIDSDFTVAASMNWAVRWDHTFNPYPTWYEVVNSSLGGTNNAINILQNGVYALNYELYADTGTQPTNRGFYVSMNGVNWTNDSAIRYHPSHEVVNYDVPSYAFAGTFVFRSGAAYLPVALAICTANDADNDVGFIGDDANITYMEIVRLSCEELVGNPYDFD